MKDYRVDEEEADYPRNDRRSRCTNRVCRVLRQHALIISTAIGALLGTAFGFGIREARPSEVALIWIGWLDVINSFAHLHFKLTFHFEYETRVVCSKYSVSERHDL